MRVLQVTNSIRSTDGASAYRNELARVQQSNGISCDCFSVFDEDAPADVDQRHFPVVMSAYRLETARGLAGIVRGGASAIWSRASAASLQELLRTTRYDIGHVHYIRYALTPSVLGVLKENGVKVVQTLHEYNNICPRGSFYSDAAGVCERCRSGNYLWPVLTRCISGSAKRSGLAAAEFITHKLMGSYTRNVDMFISPSEFNLRKHVEYGFSKHKIVHVPHGVDVERLGRYCVEGDSGYCLYFGQLTRRKGVHTLLQAACRLPKVSFEIVGSGKLCSSIEETIRKNKLENVKLRGWLQGEDLWRKVSGARVVVVPSEWYENAPLVVLEAGALGKPVVASRIGGIPEYIREGETGLLFEPGDVEELCSHIAFFDSEGSVARKWGRAARGLMQGEYSLLKHEASIRKVYEQVT